MPCRAVPCASSLLCSIRNTSLVTRASAACSDRDPLRCGGGRGRRDLWDICRIIFRWIAVAPPLQTCVRDGEGAGAAGSRPHRQRRPGGEIVEWEERNTGVRLRLHPSTQPPEVRVRLCCFLVTAAVSGESPPLGCTTCWWWWGIPAVVSVLQN